MGICWAAWMCGNLSFWNWSGKAGLIMWEVDKMERENWVATIDKHMLPLQCATGWAEHPVCLM